MNRASVNALAVVEMNHSESLAASHGVQAFKLLQGEYEDRLKQWIRPHDQLKSLDGSQMVAVLKGVGTDPEVGLAAAKLERLFTEPVDLLGKNIPLKVNAGFMLIDKPGMDIKHAISKAKVALKKARKSPHIYELYTPEIESSLVYEDALIAELEAAVEQGELVLYYQPKIHAGFGNLVGAEALMRWHRKRDKKVLNPHQFIDVAERYAVIQPMTWWALKSAIARLGMWPEELSIAVNVTPWLLDDGEIVTLIADLLSLYNVAASRLTIEVTEGLIIDNTDRVHQVLLELRKLGVKVSIDDFGTGFSSLSYFRDLPADELKVDKSFVMPMLTSAKDLAIVKAVIDLAHNFSLKVVAEGVESEAIAKRLSELGCDVLQGYAFDKPLPVDDFEMRYSIQKK